MLRKPRKKLILPEERLAADAVRQHRAEFSRKLQAELIDPGWNQSDLARRVWKETKVDSKGYEQVVGKDRISAYISGKAMPSPAVLHAIAKELDMSPDDLLPGHMATGAEIDAPAYGAPEVNIRILPDRPDRMVIMIRGEIAVSKLSELSALLSCNA